MLGTRRALLLAALAAPALGRAQDFPIRPLRIVVPFAPGGASDLVARVLAEPLGAALGQPVIVDNRPGAGGNLGAEVVVRAAPDGHTLLMGAPGALTVNPHLYANMPFDPARDLAPVSLVFTTDHLVVVNPGVPARNLAEFIALARARPGAISYASAGIGATTHLFGELFRLRARVELTHIPYRGSGPAVADLVGGTVQAMFDQLPSCIGHVQAGRLRALAVTGPARNALLPAVPTAAEAGLADYVVTSWNALLVPAGTPAPIVQRLAGLVAEALALPAVRERLAPLGADPAASSPAALGALLREERARWGQVVREAGITVG
ncbi:tripartite tricarboxylate transporter substrate binding protein [Siccirubricoccus sp. G192]|uniref:Bug family tripartite tricarboxylate transporter substrate binding protein n=1 Tax=Siccirubricoccus sp. G192 TaxID=2849651 RepID=UPI001C2BE9DC|nr:tripartite tricarboxylate transporter substrate binding protein [Siccirubricoccus sp. G192]MBV1796043.1 tripartite tricarboxylate transporter substrate binding protein [Siccirubricoccus sp. G192]